MKMVSIRLFSTKRLIAALFSGKLLHIGQLPLLSLEQAMIRCGLPEAEVFPAAGFIRACLRLNPEERSSAADLDAHPWLANAPTC